MWHFLRKFFLPKKPKIWVKLRAMEEDSLSKMMENNSIANRRYHVIIVGAGMAGLSAAQHLHQGGIKDILVLESSNRCGGRIQTMEFGGHGRIIEAGANWIHGGNVGNSLFNFANIHDLLPKKLTIKDLSSGSFYLSDGCVIDAELTSRLTKLYDQLESETEYLARREETMDDFFERRFVELCEEFPLGRRDTVKSVFNHFKNKSAFHGGDELQLMCAWGYGRLHYGQIPGGDVKVPVGMGSFIEKLQEGLAPGAISLNSRVVRIAWGSGQEVVVQCDSGDNFLADHVIVTVSLGVLKKWKTSMFEPLLPATKDQVIERTGFGRVGKIFLKFDHPFWKPSFLNFCHFAWSDKDIEEYNLNEQEWWVTAISGFDEVNKNPKVLVAWLAGNAMEQVEKIPKKTVGAISGKLLRQFLSDPSIMDPSDVFVTSWCSDENFLGTYSYMASDNIIEDFNVMEEPLPSTDNPRLLFAGEATHDLYFSTMHGARSSGLREAERILNHSLSERL